MMRKRNEGSPCVFLLVVLALALSAAPALAQQPQSQPPEAAPADSEATEAKKAPEKKTTDSNGTPAQDGPSTTNGTSNDRLFYTLPNFLTLENAKEVPPLTAGQKFKVVTRSSFDYVIYPWYGFLAGVSQAENSEAGYGQGARGYGKRFGAAIADGTIENYVTSAVLPSILHQDPRFFQSGHGGFWHRSWYALSRIFVTRGDSGKPQFNYSEVFGSAISATVSTYSYHPRADRTVPNTASVWGTQIGYDSLAYVVKEFWPDIRRKLRKQKADVAMSSGH